MVLGVLATVAPPSYIGIPGYIGPKCPHILNPFLSTSDCTMEVHTFHHRGIQKYAFLVPHTGLQIPWDSIKKFDLENAAEKYAVTIVSSITTAFNAFNKGIFKEFPIIHPAFDANPVPAVLAPYSPLTNSGTCIFNHLQHFETAIGKVIHAINMTLGAPTCSFKELVSLSQIYGECLAHYSPNGYVDHVINGEGTPHCMNTPECPPVSEWPLMVVDETQLATRTFTDDQHPAFKNVTDSAVSCPYLEWNSRLGVPADVWVIITTAVVTCGTCHLVCTFAADKAHRSSNGHCLDPGWSNDELAHEEDLDPNDPLAPSKGKQCGV
ncbi:hypothetical protein GYMLUDRAFT_251003 [Collybiopsis luxurians FD-317 M1]|uniref:Uncharacterized protein n=1 Tax=Collybiopsis luxurians FD-317 M1 TaxID=944289 RepID=A0A0D0CCU0_9AGAR|nr:hypothetical protein GYMLUDRAFT_251003 [Collybiopsis luxurians FD-317 M1]